MGESRDEHKGTTATANNRICSCRDYRRISARLPGLIYPNPAWFRFAQDNAGEPAISKRFGTSERPLCAVISEPLRQFHSGAYKRALQTGEVWNHDHECSSADVYRRYHLSPGWRITGPRQDGRDRQARQAQVWETNVWRTGTHLVLKNY